jgi:oxygen-dependent protoporphyrinogen oxidase
MGFLAPESAERAITACTFSSTKYAGRAPEGHVLLRAFAGGALGERVLALDDAALVAAVLRDLDQVLGLRGAPVVTRLRRWRDSSPQYRVGHLDRVARLEERTRAVKGLALAGCAWRGVGVPDVIASGEAAAAKVLADLG